MTTEKNKVIRCVPDFVNYDKKDLKEIEFDTLDELMEIPWVKKFSEGAPWRKESKFLRFSISPGFIKYIPEINNYYGWLIAEYQARQSKEKRWESMCGVCYLKFDIKELPRFSPEPEFVGEDMILRFDIEELARFS